MKNYTIKSYQENKILIPEIAKKIKEKLKKLCLKPKISLKVFLKKYKTGKHRYFSPCSKKEREILAFYARLHDNLDAKEKFIREINFLEKIKKSDLKIKRVIPKILDYGIEKDFEWLVREHPQAPPLRYSRKLIQKPLPGMIEKITKLIFEISEIPLKTFPSLEKFNYQNYLSLIVYEGLVKKKIISRELSQRILKMIKRNFSLLEKENRYFSHGDLNLGNILSDKKEIWIIDWELIHLNNFAYDIGYLWAHLWEAKRTFRQKLMKSYINNLPSYRFQKFKRLLPVVTSYLSLGGIEQKKEKEKIMILEKRREFYLNLLKNCLDFGNLIKI